LVEPGVDLLAQPQDLQEHAASLLLGLRGGVVEALPQLEGVVQTASGLLERVAEAAGGLLAELRLGEAELLGGGGDGVVGGDQGLAGASVELLGRQCGQTGGTTPCATGGTGRGG